MRGRAGDNSVKIIGSINQRIRILTVLVLFIIFFILFLNISLMSVASVYISSHSVTVLLVIASILVLMGFYLTRRISLYSIENLKNLVTALQNEIAERKMLQDKLMDLSVTDELTGLLNRRGFFALAEHQLSVARRLKQKASMLYADVDSLKAVNDKFGHKEGDALLKNIAGMLKACFRESDIIARIGGDEFVIFPAVGTVPTNIERMASRLHDSIAAHNAKEDIRYRISVSVGLSHSEPHSVEELLANADRLMYEEKKRKKHGLAE